MGKRVLTVIALVFTLSILIQSEEVFYTDTNWIQINEEIKPKAETKLEKAEQEMDHMQEKMDYYNRVVRSIEREEAELKELRKVRIKK